MAGEVVWNECIEGVQAAIVALALTDILTANIVAQLVGDAQGGNGSQITAYPCVLVFPGAAEFDDGGTNLRDDFVYPVAVVFVSQEAGTTPQTEHRARNLLWRERVRKVFHQKRLPGGVTNGEAWNCIVRPGTPVDRSRWLNNEHAQLLMVNCTVREPRS